jgi:hypothetical protein
VLGDLVGGEVALAPHGPYRGYDLRIFWGILSLDKNSVIVVDMSIHFFVDSIGKLFCIWLSKCLMIVHEIAHHLGMECNRVSHTLWWIQIEGEGPSSDGLVG